MLLVAPCLRLTVLFFIDGDRGVIPLGSRRLLGLLKCVSRTSNKNKWNNNNSDILTSQFVVELKNDGNVIYSFEHNSDLFKQTALPNSYYLCQIRIDITNGLLTTISTIFYGNTISRLAGQS